MIYLITSAYILIQNNMLDEAKEVYDKVLAINPKYALAYFNLGIYYVKKQQFQVYQNLIIFFNFVGSSKCIC